MADMNQYYEARKKIIGILRKDFIGPIEEKEILHEYPGQYYLMGKLYPKDEGGFQAEKDDESLNEPVEESNVEDTDTVLPLTNTTKPAAAGITFALSSKTKHIKCHITWGHYLRSSDDSINDSSENKKPVHSWQRIPESTDVDFEIKGRGRQCLEKMAGNGLKVRADWYYMPEENDTITIMRVTLINNWTAGENNDKDLYAEHILFQVSMKVTADKLDSFVPLLSDAALSDDYEAQIMSLLYRRYRCYAQGHGCAVSWDEGEDRHPSYIQMDFFPQYELLQIKPADFGNLSILSMKYLAYGKAEQILPLLDEFLHRYELWISEKEKELHSLQEKYKAAGKINLDHCRQALKLMRETAALLKNSAKGPDTMPWKAFQLANEAMFLQRVQTLKNRGETITLEKEETIRWYPFQLAFILHEIPSIINPRHKARKIADLLWFPTGGGKTEAYLGISAFTILLRRMRHPGRTGVAVFMRYTLRLLTLQQFQRAAMMIIACEKLRQDYHLFSEPVSIGLWVGANQTPNELRRAMEWIRNQIKNGKGLVCPWCGKDIREEDFSLNDSHLEIHCSNPGCITHDFAEGLPYQFVDEDLYENPPDFLVATVDKFAQLPKNEKPAALLGIQDPDQPNPPDLIIQDELHLISGPLGSVTGLYETIIDALCTTKDGIPAKIIASTATVKNARQQIGALFARDYFQFPPQGLESDDSFFAVKSSRDESPSRLYCGVMGSGATPTTVGIRVQAALLYASRLLEKEGVSPEVLDNYWTIVGYFNTLRELGASVTQYNDDVRNRFHFLCNSKFAGLYPSMKNHRFPDILEELTSRKSGAEVAATLRNLENKYERGSGSVIDCVMATNMLSVGVDISRLGIMVVAGQPKSNSEYIQATSRVGRNKPGIVVTTYSGTHSRDRSHYEQFMKYHSSLYRYVESNSLTPYSDRCRDKGLAAVFIGLCRYLDKDLRGNTSLDRFKPGSRIQKQVADIILRRAETIYPGNEEILDEIRDEIDNIVENWEERMASCRYYFKYNDAAGSLIQSDTADDPFAMMNSMRNVDHVSNVYMR
ncbi:helicase-related protein [uncultured Dialister sp.]|uniref:helicase-related protein n=1 Tax=uncultured Dialister sp. TaxID=278064 RepID=UPI0025DC655E|nr:helicase-related protein [uncultured Dialister sp.]